MRYIQAVALKTFGSQTGQRGAAARRRKNARDIASGLALAGVVFGIVLWLLGAMLTGLVRQN